MSRPIIETLHHLEGGTFLAEAADQLAAVVLSVERTGKPGKLTLEISVRKAMSTALALRGKITAKLAPEPPFETLLFATPEGNLLVDDPRQSQLPLAAISHAQAGPLPVATAQSAQSA
jgi:hypothetical protein